MGGFELLLEDLLRDQNGGYGPRPPGIERQVDHDLGQLGLREAVGFGQVQMAPKLFRVSVGDEGRYGDQASVSR